jgi:hypothetical protein
MQSRLIRRVSLILSLVAFCLAVFHFPRRVSAGLPTPNQPILIVQDSTSSDPYQNFVPELLTTEGLNGFQTAQLGDLTATFLANYDVVILPHLAVSAAQATLLQNYVNAGGTLVGFRPDLQLAGVFGATSTGSTLAEAWLKINTATPYGSGLAGQVLKFHGTADLYTLSSASPLATLYQSPTTSTSAAAVAINTFGQGRAILFSFDLTQSIVLTRQGNPAWAGYPNNHDGFQTMRPSQMFMDAPTGASWNDNGDNALNDVPEADEQLRLFSNAVELSNAPRRPLPRFWYFPNQARALLLMTGDQHGDAESNSTSEVNTVQSFGGSFSEFLWFPYGSISNATVNGWLASGNAVGIHFDDTGETDSSGVGGSKATWAGMQGVLNNAITSFATTFPSAPAPVTTRDHFLIWASNAADGSADQTAQAKLFQNAGIALDTTFSAFPKRWGYMTGSGLPMKFLDTKTGSVIGVYEQATQYEDDIQLLSNSYGLGWDLNTAQQHYQQSLSDSLNKYNTVVTMLFHPDEWIASGHQAFATPVLQYAQSHSIPMPSTASWLSFCQGRTAASLTGTSFSSNTLTFSTGGGPAGLTLMVPAASGASAVSAFAVDGTPQSFTVASYQGIAYATVTLGAGAHNIAVTYAPAGRILGSVTPAAAATVTTIQVQSASVTQSVQPASDGSYAVGPLPAGNYTVTPASSGYTFTPATQSVVVGGSDVSGINFAGTVNPETLFTTETPAAVNLSDGTNVNYELGTVFASDVPGSITAIRFWKGSSETGTHTGHLWTAAGQLLASVTFSNETASGWQRQNLTAPVQILANTQYVVSVNTGATFYVDTVGGLATQVQNLDLSSVLGANGVFGSPGQFPTSTFNNSNYFRDIVFVPGSGSAGAQIMGQVSPAAAAASTTIQVQGAGSTQSFPVASDGTYATAPLAAGTYTVTPVSSAYSFTPVSQSVTLGSSNVTGVNFSGTLNAPNPETLFTTQTPASVNLSDGANVNYELGTVFSSRVAGTINAIRFWKASSETGTHTGRLWTAAGQLLATATFSNETASGWQQQNFAMPVPIAANTQYVVSVNTGGTFYVATPGGLASQITNLDLSSVVGNNGLFGPPGAFPTSTFNQTNYFRDIVFAPAGSSTGAQISGQVSPQAAATSTTIQVQSATTTVYIQPAADGTYSIGSLPPGTYTVTPVSSGYSFSPASQSVTITTSNVTGINFAGTLNSETLFTTQTPASVNLSDGSNVNYELGTAFTSGVDGNVSAIRFWKASSETGTHTGNLWSATGQLLASVTFSNETAAGWQQQALPAPLHITANTTYVVSVNTGATFYVATTGGLTSQIVNMDLSTVVGNNGVFGSPGQFPTSSFNHSNYFRDIVFAPGP